VSGLGPMWVEIERIEITRAEALADLSCGHSVPNQGHYEVGHKMVCPVCEFARLRKDGPAWAVSVDAVDPWSARMRSHYRGGPRIAFIDAAGDAWVRLSEKESASPATTG
jgi:hypothetical protein